MRKFMSAAVAGLAVAGGVAAIASTAQAQSYPYYYNPPAGAYSNGYYRPAPNPYYYSQPYGYTQPYSQPYAYTQPYGQPYGQRYGTNSGLAAGLSVLGSVLGLDVGASGYGTGYSNVPVDRYGPDPNGMIAPDGHRIKCKLRRTYDSYYRQNVTRRECW